MKFKELLSEGFSSPYQADKIVSMDIPADIYTSGSRDKLGIIVGKSKKDRVQIVSKAMPHKKDNIVIIMTDGKVRWAFPVSQEGEVIRGMFSGAFIYTSDSRFKSDPVRLMDRIEK